MELLSWVCDTIHTITQLPYDQTKGNHPPSILRELEQTSSVNLLEKH
ncbi:Protein of unknown function [Pyronema omphalodes CBS 100304]|uniref:Uncharacterized protein n=1 Tax=Pyronema omphalodes (strain CBS 100304) TaxID=1076935 RepID=U4LEW9_PYROM|nr:Protein of unknown function [Pyronema omphalodes CBS 100304]